MNPVTDRQAAELTEVVRAWLNANNLRGISATVELIPNRIETPRKNRVNVVVVPAQQDRSGGVQSGKKRFRVREIFAADWKIILALPWTKDVSDLLVLLKDRKNKGLTNDDHPDQRPDRLAAVVNQTFRGMGLDYRLEWSNGHYVIGISE